MNVSKKRSWRPWSFPIGSRCETGRACCRNWQRIERSIGSAGGCGGAGAKKLSNWLKPRGLQRIRRSATETDELASALRWGLAQLPARQSEVFCLHEFGDWSYQQIADQFGLSTSAVGVMLHRTRQKLQELLKMQSRMATALKRERTV